MFRISSPAKGGGSRTRGRVIMIVFGICFTRDTYQDEPQCGLVNDGVIAGGLIRGPCGFRVHPRLLSWAPPVRHVTIPREE